jgi:tRNA dimethylallyltransferase
MLVIVGPTGVGKSRLGLDLARDGRGAILSADAMQVYRGFDRATAKPTPAERDRVPHYLEDAADPRHDFSAGDFVRAAEAALEEIRAAGLRPLVVGGTGLYVRALLAGIFPGPRRSDSLRRRLRERAARRGAGALHRLLRRVDPAAAERIGAGDSQRVVRALEVRFQSGTSLSRHLEREGGGIWQRPERYDCLKIGLSMERARLVALLERRVESFFAAGLVAEVAHLLAAGVPASANAFKGIGYREGLRVVRGEIGEDEALRLTVIATRRYAKRQMTWFRREPEVNWIPADDGPEAVLARAGDLLRKTEKRTEE